MSKNTGGCFFVKNCTPDEETWLRTFCAERPEIFNPVLLSRTPACLVICPRNGPRSFADLVAAYQQIRAQLTAPRVTFLGWFFYAANDGETFYKLKADGTTDSGNIFWVSLVNWWNQYWFQDLMPEEK